MLASGRAQLQRHDRVPNAAGLNVRPPEGWKSQVLLDTRDSAWSATGPLQGEIRFRKGKDIPAVDDRRRHDAHAR